MSMILASTSPFRAKILKDAGLDFTTDVSRLDERSVEQPLLKAQASPEDIAQVLAEAKGLDVSERHPGVLVLGGDQTLSLDDQLFHKPADMEAARRHLLAFSGKVHQLNSALALVRDGETVWRHVSVAHMHVRPLSPAFIGHYLAVIGKAALSSVGAYQIEGRGIQLFEKIHGDHYTIIGLSLLPLLAQLRAMGEIDG